MRAAKVMRAPGGAISVSSLAAGSETVFVDLSSAEGAIWGRAFPRSENLERLAASEFVATAARAVEAANQQPPDRAEVIGTGLLGQLIGMMLRTGAAAAEGPLVVIDAVGSEASATLALSRVETLGTVVLAAPFDSPVVSVAGYTEIHKRGITVVGVPWVSEPAEVSSEPGVTNELVEWALANLARAREDEAPTGAPWVRVDI